MAVIAVIIPFVMLGLVLVLGWYEEIMLPPKKDPEKRERPALGH